MPSGGTPRNFGVPHEFPSSRASRLSQEEHASAIYFPFPLRLSRTNRILSTPPSWPLRCLSGPSQALETPSPDFTGLNVIIGLLIIAQSSTLASADVSLLPYNPERPSSSAALDICPCVLQSQQQSPPSSDIHILQPLGTSYWMVEAIYTRHRPTAHVPAGDSIHWREPRTGKSPALCFAYTWSIPRRCPEPIQVSVLNDCESRSVLVAWTRQI
ncbi:hypothetical protein B0H12DRAFT_1141143 [Mycena haematopus]|nr:hypothetical protein B0H12DRAFT_1141143 [Mycena haematopus]